MSRAVWSRLRARMGTAGPPLSEVAQLVSQHDLWVMSVGEPAGMNAAASGPEENPRVQLVIDLDQLNAIALKGANRAAAFLAIGLNSTDGTLPKSLSLTEQSPWHFFPEPVPQDLAQQALSEFRTWITGNALREIDAHFNQFLDAVWVAISWSKVHKTTVPSDFVIKTISADTNAGKKLGIILNDLGEPAPDTSKLRSLSTTRNCLTHNAGVVSDRYLTDDGALEVKWLGLEARHEQGNYSVVIPPVIDQNGLTAPDPTRESFIRVDVVERTRTFQLGEPITLTPHQLHEICHYYLHLAGNLLGKFSAVLQTQGIVQQTKPAATG